MNDDMSLVQIQAFGEDVYRSSPLSQFSVIPAKAGIQESLRIIASGFPPARE